MYRSASLSGSVSDVDIVISSSTKPEARDEMIARHRPSGKAPTRGTVVPLITDDDHTLAENTTTPSRHSQPVSSTSDVNETNPANDGQDDGLNDDASSHEVETPRDSDREDIAMKEGLQEADQEDVAMDDQSDDAMLEGPATTTVQETDDPSRSPQDGLENIAGSDASQSQRVDGEAPRDSPESDGGGGDDDEHVPGSQGSAHALHSGDPSANPPPSPTGFVPFPPAQDALVDSTSTGPSFDRALASPQCSETISECSGNAGNDPIAGSSDTFIDPSLPHIE